MSNQQNRPWMCLPQPAPSVYDPSELQLDYFYENIAKPLIEDTNKIMSNGLPIDMERVAELESTLDEVLSGVKEIIANNQIIIDFHAQKYPKVRDEYLKEINSKLRNVQYFMKTFKNGNTIHRSFYMEEFRKRYPKFKLTPPTDMLDLGIPKWTAKLVKAYLQICPELQSVMDKTVPEADPIAIEAMNQLARAKVKADSINQRYLEQIKTVSMDKLLPEFLPSSPQQKAELFAWLGLESETTSKTTGDPSWPRDQIERINHETKDPVLEEITQAFIDFSFGAIVKNNFIEAFYKYSVDGKLYGDYKLLGAKSARYTSQRPNMLNMPSTGSIYAKPIKKCFTAPPGYLVFSIDYAALT